MTSATELPRRRYAPRLPPAERREQLLDAALRLLAERGYGAVTIEAVAREAGVSRPVVYGLFADLGELLTALLEREEERALARLADVVPQQPGDRHPDELLSAGLRSFLEAVAANPVSWRAILLPVEGGPPVLRERVERNRTAIRAQIERLVQWGVERRGGPAKLDVEVFSHMLQIVAEEAGRLVLTDPERYTPERLARLGETVLESFRR